MNRKRIAILGSTGSIGVQALSIVRSFPNNFSVELISCNSNENLCLKQCLFFKPKHVVINSEVGYNYLKKHLPSTKIYLGNQKLADLMSLSSIDLVLVAIVGAAALLPTISAIKNGKKIALANKECLVVGGQIVMGLVKKYNATIIPVDSEHSAIFQCLQGEDINAVDNIILTASGGPFREKKQEDLKIVTLDDALNHPNWDMGNKITIDSATLMNKGFELIETRWLFNINYDKIKVVIHPESIIHSLVEFQDGSVISQLGLPNMHVPILYALNYPKRIKSSVERLDLIKIKSLNFEEPNLAVFKHLSFAYEAIKIGGSCGCVLNAANEIAVFAFLEKKIKFLEMINIIEKSLEKFTFVQNPKLEELLEIDKEARVFAKSLINYGNNY